MTQTIREKIKTCGRCIHDEESEDIVGSSCYLCKRNPTDNRIDWFEEKREIEKIKFTGAALMPDGTIEMEGTIK